MIIMNSECFDNTNVMEYVYQVDNWTLSTWCNEINKLGPVVRLYITISPVIFNDTSIW